MTARWRLLVDGPADGAWNMAVDEALLRASERNGLGSVPTLRLYGWAPAALSLGSRQNALAAHDPEFLRREGIDLVRRPTGGRAVLHDRERTYAVVARRGEAFPGGVLDTYRRISAALAEALRALKVPAVVTDAGTRDPGPSGNPSCFATASAHEILVERRKLAGSAQVRGREAFLQHGSILLATEATRVGAATRTAPDGGRFVGLEEALGRPTTPGEVDRALIRGFEAVFETRCEPAGLSRDEALTATRLRCWKYLTVAWTLGGRWGERERERFEAAAGVPGPGTGSRTQ